MWKISEDDQLKHSGWKQSGRASGRDLLSLSDNCGHCFGNTYIFSSTISEINSIYLLLFLGVITESLQCKWPPGDSVSLTDWKKWENILDILWHLTQTKKHRLGLHHGLTGVWDLTLIFRVLKLNETEKFLIRCF